MGLRSWIGNKLFDINNTIEKEVKGMDDGFDYIIPGKEQMENRLLKFRQSEYKLWSRSNPAELSKFYTFYLQAPDELTSGARQLFWEWASGIDNIPKMHYPAPEIIMNQMKSLLFAEELTIKVNDKETGDQHDEGQELLDEMLSDNNFYELLQNGSYMETYSGTVGARFVVDTRYERHPIVKLYPAERIRFKDFMGRIQEIIFLDTYVQNKKTYTLKSIYGKGYIRYELENDKKKSVPLETVEEVSDLQDIIITGKDGKPINKLLAAVKKNRSMSSEFPESMYGGSDFEGIVDIFHFIDELYSTKTVYARRTRPTMALSEDRLEWNDEYKKYVIPKEYETDTIILKPSDAKEKETGIMKDIPTVDFKPYDDAIHNELKNVFMKIGMAYTSVGLEAHSANISGAALVMKEKPTVIVRSNKIKLWDQFLLDVFDLLYLYDSLGNANITTKKGQATFQVNEEEIFEKYDINIDWPHYNETSFDERLDQVVKGLSNGVFDLETGIDRLFKEDITPEQKAIIKIRTKIENSIPFTSTNEVEEIQEIPAEATDEEQLEEDIENDNLEEETNADKLEEARKKAKKLE